MGLTHFQLTHAFVPTIFLFFDIVLSFQIKEQSERTELACGIDLYSWVLQISNDCVSNGKLFSLGAISELKMHKNALAAVALPQTPLGELTAVLYGLNVLCP